MARHTVRLADRMSAQLEAAAGEHGMTCAGFVRQLIAEAIAGKRVEGLGAPSEEELLELLAEKARKGNVAAIRTLLATARSRAYAMGMNEQEARTEATRLNAEHPERGTYRWVARQAGGHWEIVRIKAPGGMDRQHLNESTEASARPPQPDDPRTAHDRTVGGPWGSPG